MRFEATVRLTVDVPVTFDAEDEQAARVVLRRFAQGAICLENIEPQMYLWLGQGARLGRVSFGHELQSLDRKE